MGRRSVAETRDGGRGTPGSLGEGAERTPRAETSLDRRAREHLAWFDSIYVDAIIQSFVCLARARGMETSRVHTQVERRPAA